MKLKTLMLSALAATALVSARADEVTIAGSTSGTFSNPNAALTFTGGTFEAETVFGTGRVGDEVGSGNNFGVISLAGTPNLHFSGTFDLAITFTAPAGITGGQDGTYTAMVSVGVNKNGKGGATLDFSKAGAQTFTFTSGDTSGSFTLMLNSVDVRAGGSIALSGHFTGSQTTAGVPDGGATLSLLGVGLMGLAAVRRKLSIA